MRSLLALPFLMVAWLSLPAQANQPAARPCVGESGMAVRVPPYDEGDRNPAFAEFRSRLRRTAARKDAEALMAIVHPQIKAGFDGSDGRDAFRERYLNNPDEDFWKEFGDILAMGGRFSTPDEFTAPYTFTDFPNNLDAFECLIILSRDVRLRSEPNTSATYWGVWTITWCKPSPKMPPALDGDGSRPPIGVLATSPRDSCAARSTTEPFSDSRVAAGGW